MTEIILANKRPVASIIPAMNGPQFVRRARRYARRTRQDFSYETGRGKGSHGLLYIGQRRTIAPYR